MIVSFNVSAQDPGRLRSVHGSAGSSAGYYSGKKYYVIQSIGQGVAGLSCNKSYLVRQGFVQPPVKSAVNPVNDKTIPATVTPNYQTGEIVVNFKEEMPQSYYVHLINMTGTVIYRKKHYTSPELRINFGSLMPGAYFLRITTTQKSLISKMIWL
ncbi:MAG TPA: T9SS type A sorting domain-containing protein [Bacteroidales bacterium]|nr:T9SS type A sorting domain-containing protein [Bacteroidales bacterium]